jgi:hypothetical protein
MVLETTKRTPSEIWALATGKVNAIRTDLVDTVIKHLGRRGPKWMELSEGDPAIVIRDSVLYRAQSLAYHLDIQRLQFEGYRRQFVIGPKSDHQELLHGARQNMTFLADDVLFNTMSLLDYTGNLLGAILAGSNAQNVKWNGLVKSARDSGNPLSGHRACRLAVVEHAEWVDALQGVRAQVIHNRVILGDGRVTFTLDRASETEWRSDLSFPISPLVVRRLRFLTPTAGQEHVELVDAFEAVALRALDSVHAIVLALLEDLGGRVGPARTEPKLSPK